MLSVRPDLMGPKSELGSAFDEVKAFIVGTTGHARLAERDDLLLEKILRRISLNGLPSLESYADLLKAGVNSRNELGRNELDCLIAELTIGETSFFRHQEHFDALRDHVLPACIRRNAATRQLRIWSAGCANGAEAYSIAILVHALLGSRLSEWNVAIVGSDINRAFLAEAEIGRYSDWTLRDMPETQRPAFFVRRSGGWGIRDTYKRNVRFVYHNLVAETFRCFDKNIFSFDIIMCRNVMIYFDPANNRLVAERLATALVDGGWLFTGPADFNPHLDTSFILEKLAGALIYRTRPPQASDQAASAAAIGRKAELPSKRGIAGAPRPAVAHPRSATDRERSNVRPSSTRHNPRVTSLSGKSDPALPRGAAGPQPDIATLIALANKGEWVAATRYCEEFLRADSCNAPAHYYYALVQQYSGAPAAAEQALRRAIYLDSRFALAHYQLGLVRKDAHDLSQSGRSFRNVLDTLRDVPDDLSVSPCGQITADDLRELAAQQLELLGQQRTRPS